MENLPKGTLSEYRAGSNNTENNTATDANIKVSSVAPTNVLDKNPPSPSIDKEPMEPPSTSNSKEATPKEPCLICKAKSIASLAFSFSLVILVLAFSFSLVKTPK